MNCVRVIILSSWCRPFDPEMPVGGPDRPAPVKRARDILSQRDEEAAPRAGSVVASAAAVQSSIYNRLTSALNERGSVITCSRSAPN